MLRLFGGSKSDHPMADLKEARRILDEVPANDAFKALDELAHWLESVRTAEGFKPEHSGQLTQLIDEAAQLHVRKLQRDYLSNPRLSRVQEQRFWSAIHSYWAQAAQSFSACAELFAPAAKGDALKNFAPLLCVRALRASGAQMKWQYVRYGPFDDALWRMVSRVYALAESRQFAQSKVAPYPGVPGETSAEHEFLRVVMLAASSPHSLLPAEIDIAERLIAHFSGAFRLTPAQQPDSTYYLDLAKGLPPQRLSRPPQPAPTLRFFVTGGANRELQQLIQNIGASGLVPSNLNLAGYEASAVLELLRHLALYWSEKPPERRHPRHRVKSRLNVTPGFDGVCSAVDPNSSLDFQQNRTENWIVEDVSAGGFGASIPQLKGEWLKLGCLLALQPEGGDNWLIGLVRRLNRDSRLQGSVGIQTLARSAAPVRLRTKNSSSDAGSGAEMAIELNPSDEAMEVQLLLRAGVYAPGETYEFERNGKTVVLIQPSIIEQGEDYELLRARQMIRDTGE